MQGITRQALTLTANSITTIEFNGSLPNYFRINNGGSTRIYAGLVSLPTPKLYDFKIEPNQVRMYCTDKGYPRIYLFNPSGSPVDIICSTFIEEFSPEVLAFTDFNVADSEDQTINVEIGGFTESLPQGNNKIGSVDVVSQPEALYTLLNEIKNKIGTSEISGDLTIDMTSTNTILDSILSKIPVDTEIDYSVLLGQIKDYLAGEKDYTTILEAIRDNIGSGSAPSEVETHIYSQNSTIAYGQYWSLDKNIKEVVFVSNDGEAEMNLILYDNGEAIEIKLKAGEVINNITGKFTQIGVDTAVNSVTIPYRVVFKYV